MSTADRKRTIALCGFMACGKSTLGMLLAQRLGYAFADTDEMLAAQTGMTLAEMFKKGGEAYFRDCEHEIVRQAAALADTVVSTGGGVMTFERNARLLAERAQIIHIHRDFDACYASIAKRANRPLAGRRSREELRALYDARLAAYARYASLTVENDGAPEQAVDAICDWLRG